LKDALKDKTIINKKLYPICTTYRQQLFSLDELAVLEKNYLDVADSRVKPCQVELILPERNSTITNSFNNTPFI